jgi:DNA-binding ferritin-like protein
MEFQKLLACLILNGHNLRVLHWNIKGLDFDPVHSLLGGYYDQIGEYIDAVAELGMQANINPLGLMEAMNLLDSDEGQHEIYSGETLFTSKEVFDKINNMFTMMIGCYDAAMKAGNLTDDIVNKLQEHQNWLRLELSFKNKKRLS